MERDAVKDVFLALPHLSRRDLLAIVRRLSPLSLRVKTMLSIEDIAAGRVAVTDLVPVEASNLLGREPVVPDAVLLARAIRNRCVMVTGAGGSIGSESSGTDAMCICSWTVVLPLRCC